MSLEQKPALPDNFTWQDLQETKASIPIPTPWFYLRRREADTLAFFLTKEAVVNEGIYVTGLSVNIIRQIRYRTGRPAVDLARGLMETLPVIPLSKILDQKDNPLVIYRRYFAQPTPIKIAIPRFGGGFIEKVMEPTTFYVQTVANQQTDTAWIVQFETPSRLWEQDKQTARIMIENAVLDREI